MPGMPLLALLHQQLHQYILDQSVVWLLTEDILYVKVVVIVYVTGVFTYTTGETDIYICELLGYM